jgi:uncharacterized protein YejL (UPF0352 family)
MMDIVLLVIVIALGILMANLISSSVGTPQAWAVAAALVLLLVVLVLVSGRPFVFPR